MRVVCIDDNCKYEDGCVPVKKGCIYMVLEEKDFTGLIKSGKKCENGTYYKLVETGCWHHHSLFIPITENQVDETELLEQRQTQHA